MRDGRVTDSESLESLILRVAGGDRAGFAALLAQEGARVWGLCRRYAGDAERSYPRCWVAIWQAAPDFAASGFTGDDWLVLVVREVIVTDRRAARTGAGEGDAARLADLPPPLPRAGVLSGCLASLPPEDAEAVVRALEAGESEAELAARFGVPQARMARWLDRTLVALDLCLGGAGGSAAARQVLGLTTPDAALEFLEAAAQDRDLRAGRLRWAHAVAGAFAAPPVTPPAGSGDRIGRLLFDETGGGILRKLGLIPSLVAALIGALFLLWITDNGGGDPLGEPLVPQVAAD